MFVMTSLQLRFLLASIPHQPLHLQTSPDQPFHLQTSPVQLNQLEEVNQLDQPNQLNQPNPPYEILQPLQQYQPHEEITLKSIGISKGSQKFKLSPTLIPPEGKETEPQRAEQETPWKKRAPGHVLLYIPPNVAKHAVNKGFTGKKPQLENILGPYFRLY